MNIFDLLAAIAWPPLTGLLLAGCRSLTGCFCACRACAGAGIVLAGFTGGFWLQSLTGGAHIAAAAWWYRRRRAALPVPPRARGPPARPCQRARPAAGSTALPALYQSLPLRHHRAPGGGPAPARRRIRHARQPPEPWLPPAPPRR
jgi:hypothetical protein